MSDLAYRSDVDAVLSPSFTVFFFSEAKDGIVELQEGYQWSSSSSSNSSSSVSSSGSPSSKSSLGSQTTSISSESSQTSSGYGYSSVESSSSSLCDCPWTFGGWHYAPSAELDPSHLSSLSLTVRKPEAGGNCNLVLSLQEADGYYGAWVFRAGTNDANYSTNGIWSRQFEDDAIAGGVLAVQSPPFSIPLYFYNRMTTPPTLDFSDQRGLATFSSVPTGTIDWKVTKVYCRESSSSSGGEYTALGFGNPDADGLYVEMSSVDAVGWYYGTPGQPNYIPAYLHEDNGEWVLYYSSAWSVFGWRLQKLSTGPGAFDAYILQVGGPQGAYANWMYELDCVNPGGTVT